MFGKTSKRSKNGRNNGRSEVDSDISVISKDMQIMGDCTSEGHLRIHGKVSGNVTARSLELTSTGSVNGDVIAAGVGDSGQLFVINGAVDGRVRAAHVEVGPHGSVTRGVVADDAVIHGRVQRGVRARDRLALGETAIVVGDLYARRLSLTEGAVVNGTVRVSEPAVTEAPRETRSRDLAVLNPHLGAVATAWSEQGELSSEVAPETTDRESYEPAHA